MATHEYALITGGSQGIGRAIAHEFAARGIPVLLVALPGPELDAAAEESRGQYGCTVHTLAVDLASLDGPQRVAEWCAAEGFELVALVNNAGLAGTSVFETSSPAYNDERVLVNVRATVLLTRLLLPNLLGRRRAWVLNMSSMAAFFPIPYKAVYAASKAFVLHFSRALRTELSGTPVSVTAVCPNGVASNDGTSGGIRAHGVAGALTSIDIRLLARQSVDAMMRGRAVFIPNPVNRLVLAISALIPLPLRQRMIRRRFAREVALTLGSVTGTESGSNG